MTTATAKVVFVPGAWMGSWIWEPSVDRLRDHGIDAEAITLKGLEADESDADVAEVRLDDHVRQVVDHIVNDIPRPAILVSHSYSGMVTATAADRLDGQVIGLIHVGAFVARNGRSLLDDWGDSDDDRGQERTDIESAGNLWHAPTRQMLDFETDLSPSQRDLLASRLAPHPGRTILDRAELRSPAAGQPTTYVALAADGGFDEAWRDAPEVARTSTGWRRRHLASGHWPMISAFDATVDLLEAEIRHYSAEWN